MKSSKKIIAAVAIIVAAALLFWLTKTSWETSTGEIPQTPPQEETESSDVAANMADALAFFASDNELKEHVSQTDWNNVESIPDHLQELASGNEVIEPFLNGITSILAGDTQAYRLAVRDIAEGEGGEKAQDMRVVLVKGLYTNAIDHKVDESWSRINLSNIYLLEERPMDAVRQLLTVEKQDPENPEAIYRLAMMSVQSGQLEKARDRFKKLVSLQPQNSTFREQLLSVCRQLNDSECVDEYSE